MLECALNINWSGSDQKVTESVDTKKKKKKKSAHRDGYALLGKEQLF